MMRDPVLNGEPRSMGSLAIQPPHGRQTRATIDFNINAGDDGAINGTNGSTQRQPGHLPNGLSSSVIPNGVTNGVRHSMSNGEHSQGIHAENAEHARPSALQRAKSDFGPRHREREGSTAPATPTDTEDQLAPVRHGWDEQYTSNEYLQLLHSNFFMYYTDKRHDTNGVAASQPQSWASQDWRMRDRLKTVSAALAICLNIGVDPPDSIKTTPCAKLEAWIDPTGTSTGSTKTMEQIGKRLQEQYETLSLRTRYKQYLDPSVDETKRFCISLRRNAKDERVLFHYNGHGVPLPTASGELWVFNKNYTQYIPVGIYELQSWLAGPSLFVYDVSHAGNIVANFGTFIEKHEKENAEARRKDPNAQIQNYSDCIQLAACRQNEKLPTNPNLPADLFTCCLTTPIDIALRFFVLQNPLPSSIQIDDGKIPVPGRLQDRRSPLGELNWIFTAITDTIAWNLLPPALFKKLFRQDLMVAALFRNFLLSERIMRANQCHPMSSPELPQTHHHTLWQSWDLAIEMVLAQLPNLIEHEEGKRVYVYEHSTFFTEQLTAFEVYLNSGPTEHHTPNQLPIVLQVLLSQAHRLRALILLSKFLDLGPWAVHLALSIGIFPYVVKLLQAAALELKPVMVFIWARIMAVDHTVQSDLLKDNGIQYFTAIMNPHSGIPVANATEHRAMSAFIVATFCKNYLQGQTVCLSTELFDSCLTNVMDPENPLLRQWSCLALSLLWCDYPDAKWMAIRCGAHLRLCSLNLDPVPEVRAAMLHALTNFLGIPDLTDQVAQIEEGIANEALEMIGDGSSLVRKELLVFFSTFVKRYENKFIICAYEQLLEEKDRLSKKVAATADPLIRPTLSQKTIYRVMWKEIMVMSVDPHPEVARFASIIVDCVHEALIKSPMAHITFELIDEVFRLARRVEKAGPQKAHPANLITPVNGIEHKEDQPWKSQSYLSLSLRKTGSALRNLAFGASSTSLVDSVESKPQEAPQKPQEPPKPVNTPRGRLPAEWSQPPIAGDPAASVSPYHQAVTPQYNKLNSPARAQNHSIPLKSTLFEWSTEYFREPQMRPNEPEEAGTAEYNARLWRRVRNEEIIAENQPLKDAAGSSQWTRLAGFMNNGSQPMKLSFHQFDDHMAVTDGGDTVTIWDYTRNIQVSKFSNSNPPGSRINDAKFVNEDDQPLLMVGSSDGVLKVYRNYEDNTKVRTVTAFRALSALVPSTKNAGLVFDWQQGQGRVLVAGDTKVIKGWNAATEMCVDEFPARSSSCVTSLTSDQVAGQIFIAGYGDGCVRVFDQRCSPRESMVRVWREHRQWVVGIHMQRGGLRELVSGARSGEVKLWDLRQDYAILTINAAGHGNTLRSLSVHEHAPVFAVGTDRHEVRSFNMSGERLGVFEPVTGNWRAGAVAIGGRKPAIVATQYHPHKMLLAAALLGDAHVSLLGY